MTTSLICTGELLKKILAKVENNSKQFDEKIHKLEKQFQAFQESESIGGEPRLSKKRPSPAVRVRCIVFVYTFVCCICLQSVYRML